MLIRIGDCSSRTLGIPPSLMRLKRSTGPFAFPNRVASCPVPRVPDADM